MIRIRAKTSSTKMSFFAGIARTSTRRYALPVGLLACAGALSGDAMRHKASVATAEGAKRAYHGGDRGQPQLLIGNPGSA